ncbi:MAG: excinuclease ABC subunit C [Candidatus Vogelbacteria bacterium CG22_combo_CG10-13_8_21_14_all_37_9]|uniref:Excinuclease ABC subunit C n=1 Tax=Candidatus Vogelbacteria bacterium CG22_combo_CG10-13_8_21_14_all_37_9 TaxID=1975046 RepID=A0A2H0BKX7_9BACT|nr:MAG: excinuclease ABC subunit C [Candidatus Vogelbacteria bacterium CG22_combo_CG10-13_8_21_14_all_37_9]
MYYVYVIKRENKLGYYIGYTNDLRRRFKEHNSGQKCKLLYYEAYLTEALARRRELKLKQFGGAWRSLRIRLTEK